MYINYENTKVNLEQIGGLSACSVHISRIQRIFIIILIRFRHIKKFYGRKKKNET